MRKLLLLNLILLILFFDQKEAIAQSNFSHAVGLSQYYAMGSSGSNLAINYSPRVNFAKLSNELTLSAGSHLGLGIGLEFYDPKYIYDIPAVLELNFGNGSSSDSGKEWGGFVGGGYGLYRAIPFGSSKELTPFSTHGYLVNAGMRGILMGYDINFRLSYLIGTGGDKSDVISLGLFYTLGGKKVNTYW